MAAFRYATFCLLALTLHVAVESFRMKAYPARGRPVEEREEDDRRKCGRVVTVFKKTCGRKGDSCNACVEEGKDKLTEACGEKTDRVAQAICKRRGDDADEDDKVDGRPKCGGALVAFKKTCGRKGDGCNACVEEGKDKLAEACGEKADRVAQSICKRRGGDDADGGDKVDDRRKCGRVLAAFKKTCGRKGDGCDACVEEGKSKLEESCGEKADRVAQAVCKRRDADDADDEGDDRRKCGRVFVAFKKTCGRKGDGCVACVEEGKDKLAEACGEKADRVAQSICKRRGQDDDAADASLF